MDNAAFNFNRDLVFTINGMEMRRRVIAREHADHYSKEPRYFRHGARVPPENRSNQCSRRKSKEACFFLAALRTARSSRPRPQEWSRTSGPINLKWSSEYANRNQKLIPFVIVGSRPPVGVRPAKNCNNHSTARVLPHAVGLCQEAI